MQSFVIKSRYQDSLVVIAVILLGVSPLLNYVFKTFFLLVILIFILKDAKLKINTNTTLFFIFGVLFFLPSIIVDIFSLVDGFPFTGSMLYIPLCFFVGYIISIGYAPSKYICVSERFIFISAIFSLVSVVIFMFFPSFFGYMLSYEYGGFSHKTAFVFNLLATEESSVISRNTGIASEPGLYQLVLHLGLWMHFRFSEQLNIKKIIIYVMAIFFTFSTVGLVLLLFVLFYFLNNKKILLWLLLIGGLFIWQIIEVIQHQIEYKLIGSSSFIERFEPMMNIFTISGTGLFGLGAIKYTALVDVINIGGWDSFSQVLVRNGYVSLLLFGLLLFLILLRDVYLFCILLLTFASQSVWFLTFLVPFYLWAITGRFIVLQKIKLRYLR